MANKAKKEPEEQEQRQFTNEEQMMSRQSAPRPTMQEEAIKLVQQQNAATPTQRSTGFLGEKIGKKQIDEAYVTLLNYKKGKANLEKRIVDNEQWYKLRHWECLRDKKEEVQPTSAWLFNCIANKHADAMDNYPSPNILPREEGDKEQAEMLSSIVPVVLEQNDFEKVYSDVWTYKLRSGTGVYGVYWDKSKFNGLGDISIKKVDLINLFWEPGITDIQNSRNIFCVELADNDVLIDTFPQLEGKLGSSVIDLTSYVYDDNVDTSNKSAVIDWYYKKHQNGRVVLHYCKFINDVVLFATENKPEFADRGWYDHGLYPFIFDNLYSVEGTPTGFGYIDVGKDAQAYIDRGNQAIISNMLANTRPRYFIRDDGTVKEEEYADLSKDFVHVSGANLGQDSIMPIQGKPLNGIYVQVINNKIDELKETTGNRDISTGGTSAGVTAASAIAAMQEAGSKLSRDNSKAAYRSFRQLVLMVIELIRQFYDMPRCFRIMGQNGTMRFIQYSNEGILPQMQGNDFGIDFGQRIPLFDIEVTAQKSSPYSKMAQNELALQFYSAGFFNPQMYEQALACLDMMDFDGKEGIMQKIAQNGMMYQQLMMQQQAMMMQQAMSQPEQPQESPDIKQTEALGGKEGKGESSVTENARKKTANATSPN